MSNELHLTVTVLPGNRIEVAAPELPVGEQVNVTVTLPQSSNAKSPWSLMNFLNSLPIGPRSAASWEEIESRLVKERNSWER